MPTTAAGDAMSPTMETDDLIIVDNSKTRLVHDRLVMVDKGGGDDLFARLRRTGKGDWWLDNDNKKVAPQPLVAPARVTGTIACIVRWEEWTKPTYPVFEDIVEPSDPRAAAAASTKGECQSNAQDKISSKVSSKGSRKVSSNNRSGRSS